MTDQKSRNDRLIEFFVERGLDGIVSFLSRLIEKADGEKAPIELGLTHILDKTQTLDVITLAMSRFGFKHMPALFVQTHHGAQGHWRKSMRLYRRADEDGNAAAVDTLGWFWLFSEIVDSLPTAAVRRFDQALASMVGTGALGR